MEVKERIHDVMQRAGIILRYRTLTRAAWIKIFQWSIETYIFVEVKERIHDVMQRAGIILRYRTFTRDYNLQILTPELKQDPFLVLHFLCKEKIIWVRTGFNIIYLDLLLQFQFSHLSF